MRIKRIYIKDFGIFRDEKLEDLNKDIVVIGGYNRAGKTTFSRLFRYLGFGFNQRDKDIPEANVNYGVSYDIENNQGEIFNVDIQGRRFPIVTGINTDRAVSVEELYGNIDYFTYKQLFNISLDELQNTSIENTEEMSNMQSILLGAGYKQVIQIPAILRELEKESRKIGGKNGSPSTAQFKPYHSEIKEGLKLRHKAKLQVDTYYEKKNLLSDVKNKICILKEELQKTDRSKRELSILKSNFNNYKSFVDLDIQLNNVDIKENQGKFKLLSIEKSEELKKQYEKLQHEYNFKEGEFIKATGQNKELQHNLIKSKDAIKAINEGISGITEGIKNYNEIKENCIRLKSEISKKIIGLNENWKDDFSKILSINTDALEFHKLSQAVELHKELVYKKKELESELKNIKSNKEVMSRTVSKKGLIDTNKIISKCFYIALVIIMLGIALAFIDYRIGVGLAISSGILGGTCIIIVNSSKKAYLDNKDVYLKLNEFTTQLHDKSKELEKVSRDIESGEEVIKCYRNMFHIEENVSGDMLKDYFVQIKHIKGELNNLQELLGKASSMRNEVEKKLADILSLIDRFPYMYDEYEINEIKSNLIERSSDIFLKFRKLISCLEHAEELSYLEYEKAKLEERIKEIVGEDILDNNILKFLENYIEEGKTYKVLLEIESERNLIQRTLVNAFKLVDLNLEINEIKSFFDKYVDYDEIEKEYKDFQKRAEEIQVELEKLIKMEQTLRLELEVLYSAEDIDKAERKIYNAKNEMFPLAKKYASLKGAEFILKKLQENFVDKTKDSLLKGASRYLEEITNGEYIGILPGEDLGNLDFKALLKGGEVKESSNILSRATKEQLFLSVRLSRIREISPHLPIILDDSFVNFDESHTREVIKVLSYLSKTNQVFITTCHSRLVSYLGVLNENIKYIKLEKGKFSDCNKEELITYLDAY